MSEQQTPSPDANSVITRIARAKHEALTREYTSLQERLGTQHAYELLAPSADKDRSAVRATILASEHAISELCLADLSAVPDRPESGVGKWQEYARWEAAWRREWAWKAVASATGTDPEKVADHFAKKPTDYLTMAGTVIECISSIEQAGTEVRRTLGAMALIEQS